MYAREYVMASETYRDVLKHRKTCPVWKLIHENKPLPPLCPECFGGGLVVFGKKLVEEFEKDNSK